MNWGYSSERHPSRFTEEETLHRLWKCIWLSTEISTRPTAPLGQGRVDLLPLGSGHTLNSVLFFEKETLWCSGLKMHTNQIILQRSSTLTSPSYGLNGSNHCFNIWKCLIMNTYPRDYNYLKKAFKVKNSDQYKAEIKQP